MRYLLHIIKEMIIISFLRICYIISLKRLRLKTKKSPIDVYFFVSEIAKWKAQSLYDLLESDKRFTPYICVYPMQKETKLTDNNISDVLNDKISDFQNKGMRVINIWDIQGRRIEMSFFNSCGIIFYQQPWDVPPAPSPLKIAKNYLTFYIPYYLVNNFDKKLDLCLPLQRQVYRYIVLNDSIKEFFLKQVWKYKFAGKIVGLGHTCTDAFHTIKRQNKEFAVIYAPHFSFPCASVNRVLYYSTFLDNGELILEFAKKHRDVRWIFKPHPRLKSELEVTGVWSKEKIDQYFNEWETIGESCYSSDYQELFVNSDVMLTDCGSFLTEYACTGNPIIRMISPLLTLSPNPLVDELYSTYYCVNNNDELKKALEMLIVQKKDPQKEIRHYAIEKVGLGKISAAEQIRDYISDLLQN